MCIRRTVGFVKTSQDDRSNAEKTPSTFSLVASNVAIEDLAPCVCVRPGWPCAGCDDKAKDLYDTAQGGGEAEQPAARYKLYRQIVEEYPDSPYANQA